MQSNAAQFIQVRVHMVFLLSQIETPKLQPFRHWCGCCSAEDLGLVLDRDLTMTSHITGLVRTSFALLRQLRSVSRSLKQVATRLLVQSLILSLITAMSPLPACHNAASFGSRQSSTLLLVWFSESRSLTTSQP